MQGNVEDKYGTPMEGDLTAEGVEFAVNRGKGFSERVYREAERKKWTPEHTEWTAKRTE